MKRKLLIVLALFASALANAQSPEKFNYQAVARDASGNALSEQSVGVRISILQGSSTGTSVYSETHTVTTNAFGLFNFQIGDGTAASGSISGIDWSNGSYFIKVEFDGEGGTNYAELSTTQLVSVPYALFANSVANDNVNDADADPTNEIQTLSIEGDTITLTNGGSVILPTGFDGQYSSLTGAPTNVSSFTNDAGYLNTEVDGSITNEIQTLSISNDTVYLTDGGFAKLPAGFDGQYSSLTGAPTNVSTFTNDAGYLTSFTEVDGSVTNEIQSLSFSNDTLYLSNGGSIYMGGYTNVDNYDNDSTNEIQTISFSNDTVYLDNGGSIYLGDYANELNLDNDSTNEIQVLSISNDTIYLSDGGFAKLPVGFDGQYSSLSGSPTNVSSFTNDAGYLTSFTEVDGSTTNEIQTLSISGSTVSLSNGGGSISLPAEVDGSTTNEIQTLSISGSTVSLSNGGGSIALPAEVDGSTTNEIQTISISNDTIYLTDGGFAKLPAATAGFDGQYSSLTGAPTNVSTFTNDAGYLTSFTEVDGSTTNEIQTLSISGTTVSLSNGGGSVALPADADWTISGNNQYSAVSGNVGIGTNAPDSKLHVEDLTSNHMAFQLENNDAIGGIEFETQTATAVGEAIMNIGVHTNRALADKGSNPTGMWMRIDSRASTKSFDWYFEDAGSNTESHLMKLNNTGNLTLNGAYTLPNSDGTSGQVLTTNGSGAVSWTSASGGDTDWTISGTNMYSGVTGNVGVGTATPTDKMDIEGNVRVNGNEIYLRDGSDVNHGLAWYGTGKLYSGVNIDGPVLYGWSGGALGTQNGGQQSVLRWTNGGNVGIGTTTPAAKLTMGNNIATGGLDNYSEYQIVLYQTAAAANAYGMGVRGGTFVMNTDDMLDIDVDGVNAWRFHDNRLESYGSGNSVFVGRNAGMSDDLTDNRNVGIGYGALSSNTTGANSVGVGTGALDNNTTGIQHVAIGHAAGFSATTSSYSTVVGYQAGTANTADYTTAVGHRSMASNTTGTQNAALGAGSLEANTTGVNNTAIGFEAAHVSTTGSGVTAIGALAAASNTAHYTTAIGDRTLTSNTTGAYNVGVGGRTMQNNTTGDLNTAVGYGAGYSNTTANGITAIGYQAANNSTINYTTAVGQKALLSSTTGAGNTAVGASALELTTTGNANTAVGFIAGNSNTTGSGGTFVGYSAGRYSTGDNVTAVGAGSLDANTTGYDNAAVGASSLGSNTTGHDNTAVGKSALFSNATGNYSTALGSEAIPGSTADWNTAIGHRAGYSITTGAQNTAVGGQALDGIVTGNYNTAVGVNSLYNMTLGSGNVGIGRLAGDWCENGTTCTFIGTEAGNAATLYTRSNFTAIGYNAPVNNNNTVIVGNTSVTGIGGYAAWTNLSDGRFKKNIQEDVPGLDFIKGLRPVTYEIDIDRLNDFLYGNNVDDEYRQMARDARNGLIETGFIAQEVEAHATALGYNFNGVQKPTDQGGHYGIAYSTFVVPLVKATQEQQMIIENQQKQIDELKALVNELKNEIRD